jgi:UDP-N-acetyl-D-mannosaminuronate dehydrogenase
MYKELIKTDFDFKKKLINNKNYINKSDIIILANLHESYQKILEENLKFNRSTKNKLIFDCWNLLDKEYIQNLNWHYSNI